MEILQPQLRFPIFKDVWEEIKIKNILSKVSLPVKVGVTDSYKQIGIRSHGKGIFYKNEVLGKELGNKRVFWIKENLLIINIVFAWEQSISKTTTKEIGMIASHRFPMFEPVNNLANIDYLLYFFLTKKGKYLLGLASPGGAGRNKTLGQKEFDNLSFRIPKIEEQIKIAEFLNVIDKKINVLSEKKKILEDYKKGSFQKIFKKEIRFKDKDGNHYKDWSKTSIGELFDLSSGTSKSKYIEEKGKYIIVDMGGISSKCKLIAKKFTNFSNDILVIGDLIMPKDDIGAGLIIGKTIEINENDKFILGDHVYKLSLKNEGIPKFFSYQINSEKINVSFRKKANGTAQISLTRNTVLNQIIEVADIEEQLKIANFLSSIDKNIDVIDKQIKHCKEYKKSLLKQMFV
jgi:type I restriction enzyme S subunit